MALDLAHVQRIILVGDPEPAAADRRRPSVRRPRRHFSTSSRQTTTSGSRGGARATRRRAPHRCRRRRVRRAASGVVVHPAAANRRRRPGLERPRPRAQHSTTWRSSSGRLPRSFESGSASSSSSTSASRHPTTSTGFDRALGFDENGWVPYDDPDGARTSRSSRRCACAPTASTSSTAGSSDVPADEVEAAHEPGQRASATKGSSSATRSSSSGTASATGLGRQATLQHEEYLANGEVGTRRTSKNGWLNVAFAGRPSSDSATAARNSASGRRPARARLRADGAQGAGKSSSSEVFVVLPKQTRLLSRELSVHGAHAGRARSSCCSSRATTRRAVRLHRARALRDTRRNTNLFQAIVRERADEVPYAEHLIHRTSKGHMVRSKSELVIANVLCRLGLVRSVRVRAAGRRDVPGRDGAAGLLVRRRRPGI